MLCISSPSKKKTRVWVCAWIRDALQCDCIVTAHLREVLNQSLVDSPRSKWKTFPTRRGGLLGHEITEKTGRFHWHPVQSQKGTSVWNRDELQSVLKGVEKRMKLDAEDEMKAQGMTSTKWMHLSATQEWRTTWFVVGDYALKCRWERKRERMNRSHALLIGFGPWGWFIYRFSTTRGRYVSHCSCWTLTTVLPLQTLAKLGPRSWVPASSWQADGL